MNVSTGPFDGVYDAAIPSYITGSTNLTILEVLSNISIIVTPDLKNNTVK